VGILTGQDGAAAAVGDAASGGAESGSKLADLAAPTWMPADRFTAFRSFGAAFPHLIRQVSVVL